MPKDDSVYLGHMLDTAREARELVLGIDRSAYQQDRTLKLALAHLIQVLGEAARQVSDEFQSSHQPSRGKTLLECVIKLFTIIWP